MRVVYSAGKDDIAKVYIGETDDGKRVEFVESLQPPIPREKKWVLIVSTLFGCPGGCLMCDAGVSYAGKLSREEILFQTDYMIERRYPDFVVPASKFKVQFARMGEPSINDAVLKVLEELPLRYRAPGLIPALSSVAPAGSEGFFDRLVEIKESFYRGRFQLQFSLHSTDQEERDRLMPIRKWGLERIAEYGCRFHAEGDRKVTLNFALAEGSPVEAATMRRYFDPKIFLVKVTPVNPTVMTEENGISSCVKPGVEKYGIISDLAAAGFEVILSIGEPEENAIGSNCGQYISRYMESGLEVRESYTYDLDPLTVEKRGSGKVRHGIQSRFT